MYQGLHGHAIAFNEHGVAPRDSARGKRPGAHAERDKNARAAKLERRTRRAAPRKGPRQQPPSPPRERTVLRTLRNDIKRALRNGQQQRFAKLAMRFELMMAKRSQRLEALK